MSGYTLADHVEYHYKHGVSDSHCFSYGVSDSHCFFCRDEALADAIGRQAGHRWAPTKNDIDAITAYLRDEYGLDILPTEDN